MALKVDPPKRGRESDETCEQYEKEYSQIFDGLKERALMMTEKLNAMEDVTCTEVQGAMYAFPNLKFSDKVV